MGPTNSVSAIGVVSAIFLQPQPQLSNPSSITPYRQGLLLHRPSLFLLHALPAALADPQWHFSQEVLHERWHKVWWQPLARGNQPIVGRPSPVLALPVTEQAARLHGLVGGGQHLRKDTQTVSHPGVIRRRCGAGKAVKETSRR